MAQTTKVLRQRIPQFDDPPFAKLLFDSAGWAWLWLLIRLYLGYT